MTIHLRSSSRYRRRPSRAELADVGTGDKASPGADQYHRLDRGIGIAALDILDDALGYAGRERVDRRVVDSDDTDPVDVLETNQCAFGHVVSSNLKALLAFRG